MRMLALAPLVILTGCSVTLPFSQRINYSAVTTAKAMRTDSGPIQIAWDPTTFPGRDDVQGASGFVGGGSRTHIPTGVAIASRVTETLDVAIGVTSDAKKVLKIKVINANSKFQYSAGIFNVTPVLDYGECNFEAQFACGDISWAGKFESKSKDKAIGGTSSTGILEKAWDDVALQVCKDVVTHLSVEPPPISSQPVPVAEVIPGGPSTGN